MSTIALSHMRANTHEIPNNMRTIAPKGAQFSFLFSIGFCKSIRRQVGNRSNFERRPARACVAFSNRRSLSSFIEHRIQKACRVAKIVATPLTTAADAACLPGEHRARRV